MDRNREAKIISIVALFIAVVGVSVGFAAFSNTLTINSSAEVKPDSSKFAVNFSSTSGVETEGDVAASATPSTSIWKTRTNNKFKIT